MCHTPRGLVGLREFQNLRTVKDLGFEGLVHSMDNVCSQEPVQTCLLAQGIENCGARWVRSPQV